MRDKLLIYINGHRHDVCGEDAFRSLSSYLRYQQQAVGTKVVCEEGDCGSCTVLIGRMVNGELVYKPVNSCIQYMYQLDGTHVITIEGLKENGRLNPVQEAMVENHGAQCGFCTPGFVVALYALFNDKEKVCDQDIKDACTGNLCRCTGYASIIQAGMRVDAGQLGKLHQLYPSDAMRTDFETSANTGVMLEWEGRRFLSPVTLEEAVAFKAEYLEATLVCGGTDVHVWRNKRQYDPPVVMSLNAVKWLDNLAIQGGILSVGAQVRLSALEDYVKDAIPELHRILNVFGSPQIKHAGTLAGNIANASPIADTIPFLMVMEADIELTSVRGVRTVNITQFYKGYKQMDMAPDEIITGFRVPLPGPQQRLKLYKVSKRRNLDISTFTAAFLLEEKNGFIQSLRIAYGGVGPVVYRLKETEAYLTGKLLSLEHMVTAGEKAKAEISPISDVRGEKSHRLNLAETMLMKFFYEVTAQAQEAAV